MCTLNDLFMQQRGVLEKRLLTVIADRTRLDSKSKQLEAQVSEITAQKASEAAKLRELVGFLKADLAKRASMHDEEKKQLASKCVQLQGQVTQLTAEKTKEVAQSEELRKQLAVASNARVDAGRQSPRQESTPEVHRTDCTRRNRHNSHFWFVYCTGTWTRNTLTTPTQSIPVAAAQKEICIRP